MVEGGFAAHQAIIPAAPHTRVKQAITTSSFNSLSDPKQAVNIVLVPNREVLDQYLAGLMADCGDGEVRVAPPAYIFSDWVESLCVRLRMLRCRDVPTSADSWTSLVFWTQSAKGRFGQSGNAFELAAARQARDADRLLRQWSQGEEGTWLEERFFAIRNAARRAFEARSLFSTEDWVEDLIGLLDEETPVITPLPGRIDLFGFIEVTALEARLLALLERRGIVVNRKGPNNENHNARVVGFETPEDEWQAAVAWTRRRLDEGAHRLAIVLPPELTSPGPRARRIRQLLAAVFHPRAAACLDEAAIQDFYIPNNTTLADCSAVRDAILLVRLTLSGAGNAIGFSDLSQWLLSRHWHLSEAESGERARLELELRKRGIHEHSLAGVRRLALSRGYEDSLPGLLECLDKLPSIGPAKSPGSAIFAALNEWGWPGDAEGRAPARGVGKFLGLLEQLDRIPGLEIDRALSLLELMAANTSLPTGGGPLSPVQVLTPEIAATGSYDGMWVCNLDEANWPPPLSGNPFLPSAVRQQVPRMNPEGQLEYHRVLTNLLSGAAEEVVFSWSADGGQGPRNMSGLIAGIPAQKGETSPIISLAGEFWAQTGGLDMPLQERLESIGDDAGGLPISGTAPLRLPGGSGFFRLQAACPLLGYARYRLGAEFPDAPTPLASPQFRGELLHQALRELYQPVVVSGGRPKASDIPSSVEAALARLGARERISASALRAERERLVRVLNEWIRLDNEREGFVVEAVEETRRLASGSCEINIRFDRLDRISDDRFFILDYKSGGTKSRALKWTRDRIQEPQLPLYAVLLEDDGQAGKAGGLAFAIVSRGRCAFDGISDDDVNSETQGIRVTGEQGRSNLPRLEWQDLMAHWRGQVEMLRDEILAGRCDNRVYDADIVAYSGLDLVLRHSPNILGEEGESDETF